MENITQLKEDFEEEQEHKGFVASKSEPLGDDLTPRQWALYNLLNSDTNKWWTQREICDAIPSYHWIDDDRNHCAEIGSDRRFINNSQRVDKIIVTKKHCFKIATVEEYIEDRNRHIRRLKTEVEQIKAMDFKCNRDGQVKFMNNALEELKPENEQFHETFVGEKDDH